MCALVTGVQTCALPIFFGAAFFGAAFFTAASAGAAFFAATFLPAAGLALDLLAADFAVGFLAAGFLAALAAFFPVFLTAIRLASLLITACRGVVFPWLVTGACLTCPYYSCTPQAPD